MVETITPVVHGGDRRRWRGTVVAHAVGATAAAAAFGAALGAVGRGLGAPWGRAGLVVVAAVAALYASRELFGFPVPIPDRRRQVPQSWRSSFPPRVAAVLYGLGLGIGFLTYLRHGTLVAVVAVAAASGDPLIGVAVMGVFGLSRGLAVSVARRGDTPGAIADVVSRLEKLAETPWPRLANGVALVAVTATAAVAATTAPVTTSSMPAVALAAVFAWASAAKVLGFREWRASLQAYRLGPLEVPAAALVPVGEASVVAAVLGGRVRAGAFLAVALLAAFSAALRRTGAAGEDRVGCGCFGRTRARQLRVVLARNLGLATLAALVTLSPARVTWPRLPTGAEVLPLGLAGATAVLIAAALLEIRRLPRGVR